MKELAQEPQARFIWWIIQTFKVLPTDRTFLDLTEEQLAFMWEQYLIDNPPKTSSAVDDDYNEDEIESYVDPEFDKYWNELENDTLEDTPPKDTLNQSPNNNSEDKLEVEEFADISSDAISEVDLNSEDWKEVE